jgi:hypothetical protein
MRQSVLLGAVLLSLCCQSQPAAGPPLAAQEPQLQAPKAVSEAFRAYWYQGKAEVTSYKLSQARYGEIHEGDAVLIFVTEDFSAARQVKLDRPEAAGADRVPVLKLNLTKTFDTGIYPYSLMTSVFTPVDGRPTLKVSTSGQEWCGHVYQQLNLERERYRLRSFSYFEDEVEEQRMLDRAWLEDELWTRLRLGPDRLPQGTIRIVPSTLFARLHHHPLKVVEARATLDDAGAEAAGTFGGGPLRRYRLDYRKPEPRTLTLYFEPAAPYRIRGWEEAFNDGFGVSRPLVTRAVRNRELQIDYWNRHNNADSGLRKELGLE